MYIDNEEWKKLKDNLKKIYNNYNYEIDDDLLDDIENCLKKIEKTKSNKVYIITNNAICDDEIDYQLKGVAFSKEEAKKLFNDAIRDAKIDAGLDNLDDANDDIYDGDWHYTKTDNSFELYIDGEYNSNNFSIEIKEFDINKDLNKEKEVDL